MYPPSSEVSASIAAVNAEFTAAFNAADSARLSKVYSTKGQAMPAGAPVQVGRAAVASLFQGVMDMGLTRVQLATKELFAGEQSAQPATVVERGTYTFYDATDAVKDIGKYVVVWLLEDGHYVYSIDMFSSDGPVAASK